MKPAAKTATCQSFPSCIPITRAWAIQILWAATDQNIPLMEMQREQREPKPKAETQT